MTTSDYATRLRNLAGTLEESQWVHPNDVVVDWEKAAQLCQEVAWLLDKLLAYGDTDDQKREPKQ